MYDRWHLGQTDALDRFSEQACYPATLLPCYPATLLTDALDCFGEQAWTVPAPQLEGAFLHMINDGFVSGASTVVASAAVDKHGSAM